LASDDNCNWKHLHEYLRGHKILYNAEELLTVSGFICAKGWMQETQQTRNDNMPLSKNNIIGNSY
jgi:hypothetical protein